MVKQVSSESWKIEDYKPVAGIGYTPAELAQTSKIAFHRGDDLDNYGVAIFICDNEYLMLHASSCLRQRYMCIIQPLMKKGWF